MLFHIFISTALIANAMAAWECGWMLFYEPEQKCIGFTTSADTFEASRLTCQGFDADIMQITSPDKDVVMHASSGNTPSPVWNGLQDLDEDGSFHFLDGTSVGSYAPWVPGNVQGTGERCVVRNQVPTAGQWDTVDCSGIYRAPCEKDAVLNCDPGWTPIRASGTCVKIIKGKRRTYSEAMTHCNDLGAALAIALTKRDQMKEIMRNIRFRAHFWIGIHDMDGDETMNYPDGTNVEADADLPFKRGRSLNPSKAHYCVSMKQGRWYGKNCNKKQYYICEKP